jgi:hypothetical protein
MEQPSTKMTDTPDEISTQINKQADGSAGLLWPPFRSGGI